MVLTKTHESSRSRQPYRQVFDESVDTYSVEDIHNIAKQLDITESSSCNEDAVSLYNLKNDVAYYCDNVGTNRMPNVSDNWHDYDTINHRFADIMATAGLYTSKNDAKYMARATELGVGEIIHRNGMEYESRFHKVCVTDDSNVKQKLSDALNSYVSTSINKVLSNFPNQKDDYVDAVNEHEKYLMDLNEKAALLDYKRDYFRYIDPEEVRDRIISEENVDIRNSFDDLPYYVTERLKKEAGIYDNESYEKPWKLQFDEATGDMIFKDDDIDKMAGVIHNPDGTISPGYEPGYEGDLGGMETGPVLGGSEDILPKPEEEKKEEIPEQIVVTAGATTPPPSGDPDHSHDHMKDFERDDTKIYSAVIKWRDNFTPAGQYNTDMRTEECHGVNELLAIHRMTGQQAEKDGVEYEVLKVRVFDDIEQFHQAREEGFKTYDKKHTVTVKEEDGVQTCYYDGHMYKGVGDDKFRVVPFSMDEIHAFKENPLPEIMVKDGFAWEISEYDSKSEALPEIFDENGFVKKEIAEKYEGQSLHDKPESKSETLSDKPESNPEALPEIFDENGFVKKEIAEKYECQSLRDRLESKLSDVANGIEEDEAEDRRREEEMLNKWDEEHNKSW